MNLFSFAASIRTTALVIGVSLGAVACSSAGADEAGTATGAASAPVPAKEVSADGLRSAHALLQLNAMLSADPSSQASAAYKDFALTSLSTAYVLDRGTTGRVHYFFGDVIVEGDIIDGSKVLVVEETFGAMEAGPTYTARVGDGALVDLPTGARAITGIDLRPLVAIQGLGAKAIYDAANPNLAELKEFAAYDVSVDKIGVVLVPNGDATFYFEGTVLEGGDVMIGTAKLTINEKHDASMPEFNIVEYTATAERTID